ncbi:type III secretion system chaperone [Erwinia tasmaniensis]|uniref:type III secretion system chaperone n=1 Tax=Erwinia tasmaniensis TaxID=338565 RepID=UPI003A4D6BA9
MDQYALRKTLSDRVWQATHHQPENVLATFNNPVPTAARAWLCAAAKHLGVKKAEQQQFAASGRLRLDALDVVAICQREAPVPLWLVVGFLQPPAALHPEVWQEALLRASDVAMGLSGIALSLDEKGQTRLTLRLSFDIWQDAEALAEKLNDVNSLASSLTDLLLSAAGTQQPSAYTRDSAPVEDWVSEWRQTTSLRLDELAEQAISHRWHYSLLHQAIAQLELPPTRYRLEGCCGILSFPERQFTLLADGDRRHLLISTPLALDFTPGAAQQRLLQANSELMVLTNCSLALCGEMLCLVCRWDTLGLDGSDLASWLADLMTLSVAIDRREPTAA